MVGVTLPGRDLLSRGLRELLSPATGGWSCSWCLSSCRGGGQGRTDSGCTCLSHSSVFIKLFVSYTNGHTRLMRRPFHLDPKRHLMKTVRPFAPKQSPLMSCFWRVFYFSSNKLVCVQNPNMKHGFYFYLLISTGTEHWDRKAEGAVQQQMSLKGKTRRTLQVNDWHDGSTCRTLKGSNSWKVLAATNKYHMIWFQG